MIGWLNSCLSQIDWATLASRDELFSNTLPGLQNFTASINRLKEENIGLNSEDFVEILDLVTSHDNIKGKVSSDNGIKILSPSQAYGIQSEYLILVRYRCGVLVDEDPSSTLVG